MMNPIRRQYPAPASYATAVERIHGALEPLGSQRIAIEEALDRIAARDLVAPFQIPSHPRALRDGFAVRAGDTLKAGPQGLAELLVVGCLFPDSPAEGLPELQRGQAMEVASGAPLPAGVDAVIRAEKTTLKDDRLLVAVPVRAGSGVLFPGDDVRDSTPIIAAGHPLTPPQLGLLLAAGLSHVEIFRPPRVGLISTGDEIADGGTSGRLPGNAVTLSAWCKRFGLPVSRWVARDDKPALMQTLEEALGSCDALVTIGGTGGGPRDLVHDALESLGGDLLLEGVRLRPGRTSGFALLLGKPVFLLPGTPAANETAFLLLTLPGLLRMAGAIDPPFPLVPARFNRDLRRSREQKRWTQAIRVQLSPGTFFLVAAPLIGRAVQESQGRLAAAAAADGLLLLAEEESAPRTGDIVGIFLLSPFWS